MEEWVSVEEGIELARKFNLLYMEVDSDSCDGEEGGKAMSILIAGALQKLNDFGTVGEVRTEL